MIIPISTNTTIATWVQIQNGDTSETEYLDGIGQLLAPRERLTTIL
jgi:hypothetical protein